ncbi:unnamed protein product [Rhizophagus irregularis]|nr:unnamed protein product [Rhizophagus irregularis]
MEHLLSSHNMHCAKKNITLLFTVFKIRKSHLVPLDFWSEKNIFQTPVTCKPSSSAIMLLSSPLQRSGPTSIIIAK